MLTVLAGFVSGIISGMGIGGGAILIPALIMLTGAEQKTAQGINLVYFLPTAVFALIVHLKNKNAELKDALIIGLFGTAGAIIGSLVAMKMNNDVLGRLFGIFLGIIGIREVWRGFKPDKKNKK